MFHVDGVVDRLRISRNRPAHNPREASSWGHLEWYMGLDYNLAPWFNVDPGMSLPCLPLVTPVVLSFPPFQPALISPGLAEYPGPRMIP